MGKIANYLKRSKLDRRLLCEALAYQALVRLKLSFFPFKSWRHMLYQRWDAPTEPLALWSDAPPSEELIVRKIAWAVRSASHFIPVSTCLTRALTMRMMLMKRGIPHDLHIGVAIGDKRKLDAHAWIEHGGRAVIGDVGLEQYRRVWLEETL